MHFTSICATLIGAAAVALAAPTPPVTHCPLPPNLIQPVDISNATNRFSTATTGRLDKVLLGVGTQNYTCTNGVPTAAGAYATLYDASCLIQNNPNLMSKLPGTVVNLDPNMQNYIIQTIQQALKVQITAGVHYFKGDFATPFFDLGKDGAFMGAVQQKIVAPPYADTGRVDDKAVAWLKLQTKGDGTRGGYTNVYRLVTAGGSPPSTCDGPTFVHYAAQYWFYKA